MWKKHAAHSNGLHQQMGLVLERFRTQLIETFNEQFGARGPTVPTMEHHDTSGLQRDSSIEVVEPGEDELSLRAGGTSADDGTITPTSSRSAEEDVPTGGGQETIPWSALGVCAPVGSVEEVRQQGGHPGSGALDVWRGRLAGRQDGHLHHRLHGTEWQAPPGDCREQPGRVYALPQGHGRPPYGYYQDGSWGAQVRPLLGQHWLWKNPFSIRPMGPGRYLQRLRHQNPMVRWVRRTERRYIG